MAKNTKREPNQKALRADLAEKKEKFEKIGWRFEFLEDKTWKAQKTFDGKIVTLREETIEELFAELIEQESENYSTFIFGELEEKTFYRLLEHRVQGWEIIEDANGDSSGWEAAKDGTKIGVFDTIFDLLDQLDGMRKIQEKFAPETLNGNGNAAEKYLIERYFQTVEIKEALGSNDPVELLRKRAAFSQRCFGNGEYILKTIKNKVQVLESASGAMHEISLKELAEKVIANAKNIEKTNTLNGNSNAPEAWAIKERAELEALGFTFALDTNRKFKFTTKDGFDFDGYESLEKAVQAARSLKTCTPERIAELDFERKVERLLILRFKNRAAGSNDAALYKEYGDAVASSDLEVAAQSDLTFDRMDALTAKGWHFALDEEKREWSAGKNIGGTDRGASRVNSLERLCVFCEKHENAGAVNENLPTEGQAEKMGEYIETGWTFAQNKDRLWSAEREVDGKKVYCGEHAHLDALFAQMEAFDKPVELNEFKLPLTSVETCLVELSDEDILSRSYSLTKALKDLETEAIKFKIESETLKNEHKKTAAAIEARVNKYRTAIDNRSEYREIKCAIEYDFERSQVKIVRPDTNKVVKTRAMTKDEALASGTLA